MLGGEEMDEFKSSRTSQVLGTLKWWRELEAEEKKHEELIEKYFKCNRCVWYHRDSKYCPFKTCFKGKWGEF